MTWWWLSYAGNCFRGVVLAEADTFVDACAAARARGVSPGGQVYGHEIVDAPADFLEWFERAPRWKMLKLEELPVGSMTIAEKELDNLRTQALSDRTRVHSLILGGWSFAMSFLNLGEHPMWCFSAQLYPDGRGSTKQDWEFLGRAVAICVPRDTENVGDTIRTAPGAVHKWLWLDKDAGAK